MPLIWRVAPPMGLPSFFRSMALKLPKAGVVETRVSPSTVTLWTQEPMGFPLIIRARLQVGIPSTNSTERVWKEPSEATARGDWPPGMRTVPVGKACPERRRRGPMSRVKPLSCHVRDKVCPLEMRASLCTAPSMGRSAVTFQVRPAGTLVKEATPWALVVTVWVGASDWVSLKLTPPRGEPL